MRRWTIPVIALVLAAAVGSGAYAQAPSGGDKMDKDKMMHKKDDKMGGKMDKDKMMDKGKMDKDKMGKDKMIDKKDDKMMDKKQ